MVKNLENKINNQGYLINFKKWNKEVAFILAKKENIILNKDHWEIIWFLRSFYIEFNISPSMRLLLKGISKKIDKKKANSIYLFKLFPKGPVYQATKIAGLPEANRCL